MTEPAREGEAPSAPAPRAQSLRINAAANVIGNFSLYAVIFLLTPLALRHLGPDGWGIWQIVNAATAYATQINLSLGTAIHYQVAYNVAQRDYGRLARAFTGARLYLSGACVLLLLLLAAFGHPLSATLVEQDQLPATWTALQLTVGLTALTLPLRIFPSALAGLQRADLFGLTQLGTALVLAASVWLGFAAGMGLSGFAALMTLSAVMPALPCWILTHRLLPKGSLAWRMPDRAHVREVIGYGLSTLAHTFGTVVLYQTMKFVAAWHCGGAAAAGNMGLAVSIIHTLGTVIIPLIITLHARFGQLHGEGRHAEIQSLFERSLGVTALLVVPATLFLLVDAHDLFDAWVGREVAPPVLAEIARTTQLMLVGQGSYLLALPCFYVLLGIGEHRVFGLSMLAAAITNAVLGYLATVSNPHIEVVGGVFGFAIAGLSLGITFPYALRRFPIPLGRLLLRTLCVPAAASLPGLLAICLRPELGKPLADLAIDAALFSLLAAPGLELARRAFMRAAPARNPATPLG